MSAVLLSVLVNVSLIMIGFLLAKRRINRLLTGEETLDAIKDEINRLIVELNRTSDRNIGIIEERIGRLKRLVDEADKKIALLGKESEKVRIGADVYERLKKSKALVTGEMSGGTERNTDAAVARNVSSVPASPPTAASRVLELHRQGFEPKIIAAKTGSTLGEIELIISLAGGGARDELF